MEGLELVRVAAGRDGGPRACRRRPRRGGPPRGLVRLRRRAARGAARRGRLRDDASEVILWPEHFDVAVERGPEGRRATYGGSPGDGQHALPYLYVAPLGAAARRVGRRRLGRGGLPAARSSATPRWSADDPRAAGLAFLRGRLDALAGGPTA